MKNRINLYLPEFHPKLRLLSLHLVIATWVLTAIFCGLLYFYLASGLQNLQSDVDKIKGDKQQQEILVKELQNAVDNLKVDPALLQQVEKNQQLVNLKKRVLNELAGQEQLKSNGFSNLMLDLASHNQTGLWLTHINLNGVSVVMEGAATDSALVPKWLSSLGQTDYFSGQEFAETRLYRDSEKQLNFIISTGKESKVEKGSNNE
ncbi:PilN domain-containing protein [uncultured Paraglaciecola sp.]|uniref:PilN domain-containing protein n=1 Tax=uncultured Paraglaciecola sp. TaxID=1765024 RepID=UPI0030D83B29|tara:strand:- start:47028 stop:47642 length:615 start_codon:yes stop_codon:yes gene_type:complete